VIIKTRSNAQLHLARKLGYDSKPILSVTKNAFANNLRHMNMMLADSKQPRPEKNTRKQFVLDTLLREGEGQRLLRNATRMTIDNFYSDSQRKPMMEPDIFEKMNQMFKTIIDSPKKAKDKY